MIMLIFNLIDNLQGSFQSFRKIRMYFNVHKYVARAYFSKKYCSQKDISYTVHRILSCFPAEFN